MLDSQHTHNEAGFGAFAPERAGDTEDGVSSSRCDSEGRAVFQQARTHAFRDTKPYRLKPGLY